MNANLEMLEHMWGPSDFTVTGTLKDFDRTADLGTLTMPVLFHCGEFDEARPETMRQQAALTPNAEVAIIPGAGHLTMIDAPGQANGAIREFLTRVEAGALRIVGAGGKSPSGVVVGPLFPDRLDEGGGFQKYDQPSPDFTHTERLRLALSERSESKGEVAERLKAAVC